MRSRRRGWQVAHLVLLTSRLGPVQYVAHLSIVITMQMNA